MHYTIEKLIEGERDLVGWYEKALELWVKIFSKADPLDKNNLTRLSEEIFFEQTTFERNCGGRAIGQEIMAITGIAQFYTTQYGFDVGYEDEYDGRFERAQNVYISIKKSNCSLEVKFHADAVARSYGLEVDKL